MALDLVSNALLSVLGLAWNSLLLAIPVFLVVWLVGKPLHHFFVSKWHRSWLQGAFLASYVVLFVILIFAFFFPVWKATQDNQLGVPFEDIRLTVAELAAQFLFGLLRVAVMAALLAILLLPLILAASFVHDWLQNRIKNKLVCLFGSAWIISLVILVLVLFLIPWVVPGLIYLMYWG